MSEQSLALRVPQPPSAEAMAQMLAVAKALVEAKMVPVGIKTAGQALALILTGQELRLGPLRSVQDLYHVKGNVGMTAKLMVAQFRNAGHYHETLVRTPDHCKVELHLKEGRVVIVEFTRDEVNELGYPYYYKRDEQGRSVRYTKPIWSSDPGLMLYNRTMTKAIRTHTPEVLYGMLTDQEIKDSGLAIGEARLVSFLKEQHPDVWAEWVNKARSQLHEQPVETKGTDAAVINGESREIPPAEDNGDEQGSGEEEETLDKHWTENVDQAGGCLKTRFWTWALTTLGLQAGEVYEALGTTDELQFPSMKATKARVQAYLDKHAQPPGAGPTQSESQPAKGPATQTDFLEEKEIPW